MTSEIVKVDAANVPLSEVEPTYKTLVTLMQGPTLPARYRESATGVNDALAAVLIGREMGLGPMESINSLYIVNGQVAMSGKAMSALVHRAGHSIVLEFKDKSVTATAFRRDPYTHQLDAMGDFTFTEADAKRAGLHQKATYKAYPKIMWGWRAITALCRIYFADVITGMGGYVPEEVGIDAPVEAIEGDIVVEGDDVDIENATVEVMEVLDTEVLIDK